MANVFIIHGSYGNPDENWFPWLKKELELLGHKVFVPKFPTPENQSLNSWKEAFKVYEEFLNKDSIVVGHSLGPAFLLNILEDRNEPIRAAFFVAGFVSDLGNESFDEINRTFVDRNFDWQKIRRNCGKFFVFYSDNDPYVSKEISEDLAQKLGVEPELIKNAGHFNEKSGYNKFELLLERIKEEFMAD